MKLIRSATIEVGNELRAPHARNSGATLACVYQLVWCPACVEYQLHGLPDCVLCHLGGDWWFASLCDSCTTLCNVPADGVLAWWCTSLCDVAACVMYQLDGVPACVMYQLGGVPAWWCTSLVVYQIVCFVTLVVYQLGCLPACVIYHIV